MKKIALYDRRQRINEETNERTVKMLKEYSEKIEKNGNKIAGKFIDTCSAHVPVNERPQYTRMLDMCEKGVIDEIYVTSLSRISRRIEKAAEMCQHMHEKGIKVTFVNELVTSDELLNMSDIANEAKSESKMGM